MADQSASVPITIRGRYLWRGDERVGAHNPTESSRADIRSVLCTRSHVPGTRSAGSYIGRTPATAEA